MAFTYGFYNSLNGDRRYKAEDFGTLVGSLITDGVFENVGSKLFVTAGTGMDINVGTGKAWFNNTWSVNDSVMVLTVPQSDITRPRYDTVVLEVNTDINVRENKIKIVSGSPQTTPTKPVLVNTDKIHQHPLAHILVPAAATSITASNITIVVGQTACPFCTGILQATDITGLYNQWQADFNTWFQNLKNQLTSNVVTNLQAQIDAVKDRTTVTENKITTLQTTSNKLVEDGNNSSDAGNIMLFGLGYSKTVTNALPCTGGFYSPTFYSTLFDRIGYTYGVYGNSSTVNLTGAPMNLSYESRIGVGPVTGNFYKIGATSISDTNTYVQVFNQNGAYIRSSTMISGKLFAQGELIITGDEILAYRINYTVYISTDYGDTWLSRSLPGGYTYMNKLNASGNYLVNSYLAKTIVSSGSRYTYALDISIFGRNTNGYFSQIYHQTVATELSVENADSYNIPTNGDYCIVHSSTINTYWLVKLSTKTVVALYPNSPLPNQCDGVVYQNYIWILLNDKKLCKISTTNFSLSFLGLRLADNPNFSNWAYSTITYRSENNGRYMFTKINAKKPDSNDYLNSACTIDLDEGVLAFNGLSTSGNYSIVGDFLYTITPTLSYISRYTLSSMNFRIPYIADNYVKGYIRT